METIKEMCIEANHFLSDDMDKAPKQAVATEQSELGKKILNQLQDNFNIASEEMIPICQDTGMAVEDAINEGVRQGYIEGYLRKSVVGNPIIRENTKDNIPAVIRYSIVSGDKVKITLVLKGFGSEYQHLSNSYCRTSSCNQHLLSCKPSCSENIIIKRVLSAKYELVEEL